MTFSIASRLTHTLSLRNFDGKFPCHSYQQGAEYDRRGLSRRADFRQQPGGKEFLVV